MKTNEIPIEQRYGYHIIATDEDRKRFSPKLPTDEGFCICGDCRTWAEVVDNGVFDSSEQMIYRRRIPMEEGFELVPLDENGHDKPSVTYDGLRWENAKANYSSETIREYYRRHDTSAILAFRRRKQPTTQQPEAVGNGWVSVATALPKAGEWALTFPPSEADLADGLKYGMHSYCASQRYWVKTVTHWQPLPQPPNPEPTPAEKAWDAHKEEHGYRGFTNDERDMFIQGFNAGRGK